jgi:hypothetical protein
LVGFDTDKKALKRLVLAKEAQKGEFLKSGTKEAPEKGFIWRKELGKALDLQELIKREGYLGKRSF